MASKMIGVATGSQNVNLAFQQQYGQGALNALLFLSLKTPQICGMVSI